MSAVCGVRCAVCASRNDRDLWLCFSSPVSVPISLLVFLPFAIYFVRRLLWPCPNLAYCVPPNSSLSLPVPPPVLSTPSLSLPSILNPCPCPFPPSLAFLPIPLLCPLTPADPRSSSSLYLFTFLITILVLGLISAALLLRAYYVRRQFQRRVEAAIRAGQPLPEDAAQALGLVRPRRKNEKKVGPMPGLWESEMYIDRKADEVGDEEKGWAHLTVSGLSGYRLARCTVALGVVWSCPSDDHPACEELQSRGSASGI